MAFTKTLLALGLNPAIKTKVIMMTARMIITTVNTYSMAILALSTRVCSRVEFSK